MEKDTAVPVRYGRWLAAFRTVMVCSAMLSLHPDRVAALSPAFICGMIVIGEQNMSIGEARALSLPGSLSSNSGIVIEPYANLRNPENPTGFLPAPTASLEKFHGVRITHCATGKIFAIQTPETTRAVNARLAGLYTISRSLKAGAGVSEKVFSTAIRREYPAALEFRENEETCACSEIFPELRPESFTPMEERDDIFK